MDAPLSAESRFAVGQLALAVVRETVPLVHGDAHDGVRLLASAAVAGDASPDGLGEPPDTALSDTLRKAMPRKVRKAVPDAVRNAEGHDAPAYVRAVRQTAARAGLVVSGAVGAALGAVLGADFDAARVRASESGLALVRYWLSSDLRALREGLGLTLAPRQPSADLANPETRSDDAVADTAGHGQAADALLSVSSVPGRIATVRPPPMAPDVAPQHAFAASGEEGRRQRAAFLETLADGATGAARARLLCAAAEQHEALDDRGEAERLYRAAGEADPRDPLILRRQRETAFGRGAWDEAVTALEAEAQLGIAAEQRALALALAAEVHDVALDDPAAAETCAKRAQKLRPDSPAAALSLAARQWASGARREAWGTLEQAAACWQDAQGSAGLLVEVGIAAEAAGDARRARIAFERALELDPQALDAALGLARACRTGRAVEDAAAATARAARIAHEPKLGNAFLRAGAGLLHHVAGLPALAVQMLEDATEVPALAARAEAAAAAGDAQTEAAALEAWAMEVRRTDRALVLSMLARVHSRAGDYDAARKALREAGRADSTLATLRLVAEDIARQAGDVASIARIAVTQGQGALVAAARAGLHGDALDLERKLLSQAMGEADDDATAVMVAVDAAAAAGDGRDVRRLLMEEADREGGEHGLGIRIELLHVAEHNRRPDEVLSLLDTIAAEAPSNVIASRIRARLARGRSAEEAAAPWLAEAESSQGGRAAFAATMAAHILEDDGPKGTAALHRALDAAPGYVPALWLLEARARKSGDGSALREAMTRWGELVEAPMLEAERLLCGALATEPPDGALLARAQERVPDDATIVDLRLHSDAHDDGREIASNPRAARRRCPRPLGACPPAARRGSTRGGR